MSPKKHLPAPKFWDDTKKAWVQRERTERDPRYLLRREFRLTLGRLGDVDRGYIPTLNSRQQLREDAATFAAAMSLRLTYHPACVYVVSLTGQPLATKRAILHALAESKQFVLRADRTSNDIYISQAEDWEAVPAASETVASIPGMPSSPAATEAEELDDLTLNLRAAVAQLMENLKPQRRPVTDQLELFA